MQFSIKHICYMPGGKPGTTHTRYWVILAEIVLFLCFSSCSALTFCNYMKNNTCHLETYMETLALLLGIGQGRGCLLVKVLRAPSPGSRRLAQGLGRDTPRTHSLVKSLHQMLARGIWCGQGALSPGLGAVGWVGQGGGFIYTKPKSG